MRHTAKIEAFLRDAPDLRVLSYYITTKAVGLSRSTAGRRLKEEGTSYGRMIAKERQRRTFEALDKNPRTSCFDLAGIAGYVNYDSFCKAFEKWEGMTLRAYKKERGE